MSPELKIYIDKNHVRYMSDEIKAELAALVPDCKGDATERLFWIKNNLINYPICEGCKTSLTTKNWKPFLTENQRSDKNKTSGYTLYCGRSCSYKFGSKQESYKKTCVEKYGVDHPMKSQKIIEKVRLTNIEKYGMEWPNAWDSEKFKANLTKKYGVEKVRHIPSVHKNTIESIADSTTENLPFKIAELEKLFDTKCLTDLSELGKIYRVYDIDFKWQHECGATYLSNISERGIRACPSCWSGTSRGEQGIADFIRSLDIEIVQRTKKIIPPREIDIWLPSKKIAIEYDGTYWHSAKFESEKRCMEKIKLCENMGIQLITIQEHLWVNSPELVKSRLKSILQISSIKISGRQTKLIEIDHVTSSVFLKENHLQGSARANSHYALTYNDEIVMVATFAKSRWNKHATWELIRMATKQNITVRGGASKLISAFKNTHEGKIISYADRCWSTGNVYNKLGFMFSHNSDPSYWWIHHRFGAYSRYQTQKSKLEKLLQNINKSFNPDFSETINMEMAGFIKLYDRGNSVWISD